jgi:hypothetical protein
MFEFLAMMAVDLVGAPRWCVVIGIVMDFIIASYILYIVTKYAS